MVVDANVCVTLTGPRQVEAAVAPVPRPGRSQVLIETLFSGVSAGTELNVYRGVAPQWRGHQDASSGLFVGTPEWTYPLIYGYANVGRIATAGADVRGLSEGDVVFSYQPHCTWVVAEAADVVPLPGLADARTGVFLANVNTALNGVLDARPAFGDVVVVMGLGVIGLIVTSLLRRAGAGAVIGVDPLERRRALALEAGATEVLEPGRRVAETVRAQTGGRGADVVVEVSGSAAALNEAIRTVGFAGLVVAMSWYGGTFEALSLSGEFHHNRVRIRSSQVNEVSPELGPLWSTERRMAIARDLLHDLPVDRYVSHEFGPHEAPEAYAILDEGNPEVLQCVFRFAGEAR